MLTILLLGGAALLVIIACWICGAAMDYSLGADGKVDTDLLSSGFAKVTSDTDLLMASLKNKNGYAPKMLFLGACSVGIFALYKYSQEKKRLHRRGVEHGSAKWGNAAEMKSLADKQEKPHLQPIVAEDGKRVFDEKGNFVGVTVDNDILLTDEAQEYTADQESALKYVVTDSKNPQTLMCGTPPTAVSAGDVFLKFRRDTLTGRNADAGWAEWSVPGLSDAHDPELWYETNPSLGCILTERTIRSELGDDQVDDNIQRLGLWLTYSQKSAIPKNEWMEYALADKPPVPGEPRVFYGVKYGKAGGNVSLAAAMKLEDGRIFVEAVDCRPIRDGTAWIIAYLRSRAAEKVAVDGAAGAPLLADDMKQAEVRCRAILPTVKEFAAANALFEQNLFDGKLCHRAQPALVQIVSNCEHRAIGTGGGYGYTSILEGADVTLLEAVSLAHWAAAQAKEKKKQMISY